jgi:hypothetical protein
MRDANKMTPKQLRDLADQIQRDEYEKHRKKPIRLGKLKHDVYWFNNIEEHSTGLLSKRQVMEAVNDSKAIAKGAEFECYVDEDGIEYWMEEHMTITKIK